MEQLAYAWRHEAMGSMNHESKSYNCAKANTNSIKGKTKGNRTGFNSQLSAWRLPISNYYRRSRFDWKSPDSSEWLLICELPSITDIDDGYAILTDATGGPNVSEYRTYTAAP